MKSHSIGRNISVFPPIRVLAFLACVMLCGSGVAGYVSAEVTGTTFSLDGDGQVKVIHDSDTFREALLLGIAIGGGGVGGTIAASRPRRPGRGGRQGP